MYSHRNLYCLYLYKWIFLSFFCWCDAGMEIDPLKWSSFRHTGVFLFAKTHRSPDITFLQLTWHTAVNHSMKGKVNLLFSLSLPLPTTLMSLSSCAKKGKKSQDYFTSPSTESLKVKPLNSLHFASFNSFVLVWLRADSLSDGRFHPLSLCMITSKTLFRPRKCAPLISPALPEVLFTRRVRGPISGGRRASSGHRAKWIKGPDERFQGGESAFPRSRICTVQFFLRRNTSSCQRENNLRNFLSYCGD